MNALPRSLDANEAEKLLYRMGKDCFLDQVMLRWAASGAARGRCALARAGQSGTPLSKPRFPLDGRDAMAAGLEEGPKIGELLHEIEEFWIDASFAPSRAALIERLKDRVQRPKA